MVHSLENMSHYIENTSCDDNDDNDDDDDDDDDDDNDDNDDCTDIMDTVTKAYIDLKNTMPQKQVDNIGTVGSEVVSVGDDSKATKTKPITKFNIVGTVGLNQIAVSSEHIADKLYIVDHAKNTCSCPAFTYNSSVNCKHLTYILNEFNSK